MITIQQVYDYPTTSTVVISKKHKPDGGGGIPLSPDLPLPPGAGSPPGMGLGSPPDMGTGAPPGTGMGSPPDTGMGLPPDMGMGLPTAVKITENCNVTHYNTI